MSRIPRKMKFAGAGVVLALAIVLGTVIVTNAVAASNVAATSCSCVTFVRSRTGLPGGPMTAAGYTERVMNSMGYKRVSPQRGAILVWDAWQKQAYGDGHMAIINSASYNYSTRKWIINVLHMNWSNTCGPLTTTFTWGDLYGVNAYVRR